VISYIVATVNRPSLKATLASIECWPGDEIIVVGNVQTRAVGHVRCVSCEPGHDWGSTERNIATPLAHGKYLAHIDDDDTYAPGARMLLASAIIANPTGVSMFRMRLPNGGLLWKEREIRWGNVGTPMFFTPNNPAKMGQWGEQRDCGDLHFLQTMGWTPDEIAWRDEVLVEIGQPHV
jgi:hypothetical protein